jgi:hypothetical protein
MATFGVAEHTAEGGRVKTRAELFRACASECCAAAQNARDQNIRRAYLELMHGWRELADQLESFRSRAVAGAKPRVARNKGATGLEQKPSKRDLTTSEAMLLRRGSVWSLQLN